VLLNLLFVQAVEYICQTIPSFSLIYFGIVVFHAQIVIESGIKNYWKLKAVDSIQATGEIAEQERNMLIKTILNDNRIENILVRQG
jgi:hypothetical protein